MHEFVRVGYPNNKPDRYRFGCVPYVYDIGKYQVTNADWCAFLNAVGKERSFALKLYHKDMSSGILGGIDLIFPNRQPPTATPQPLAFACKPGWERKPVVYVRFTDACRYCNWLQTGDTEKGAYDFSGEYPKRICGAKFFLPTNDEWYKAAYFDGRRYWEYPTGDELPRMDQANFERGDELAKGPPFYFADVDEYADSPSPCGAVQMGGNAWEMLEQVWMDAHGRPQNQYRGGSFGYTETGLSRQNCDSAPYNGRCYVFGFRLAQCETGFVPLRRPFKYDIISAIIKCLSLAKKVGRKLLLR